MLDPNLIFLNVISAIISIVEVLLMVFVFISYLRASDKGNLILSYYVTLIIFGRNAS